MVLHESSLQLTLGDMGCRIFAVMNITYVDLTCLYELQVIIITMGH